jgi:hypothetical protein
MGALERIWVAPGRIKRILIKNNPGIGMPGYGTHLCMRFNTGTNMFFADCDP